jgi:probable phosphoglycerate mutase
MSSSPSGWPLTLRLVRHGESAGNVARDEAELNGLEVIDIEERDADVGLSPLGRSQASSVGRHLGGAAHRPTVVWSSPYRRAADTAAILVAEAGLDVDIVPDERLREREFGVLDRLTHLGIKARYPEEAASRARLGKFYHRPPGGESWCDVGLRVRSALDSLGREHPGEHVVIVAHQVVVYMFRYVLERMSETEVLAASRAEELANCSITSYSRCTDGRSVGMRLERFNETVALEREGTPATAEPDPGPEL